MSTDKKDNLSDAVALEYISETFTKVKINVIGNSRHTTILPFEYQLLLFHQSPNEKLVCCGAYDKIVTIAKEDVGFNPDTQVLVIKRDQFRLVLKNDRQLRAQVMVTADGTDNFGKIPYLDIVIEEMSDLVSNIDIKEQKEEGDTSFKDISRMFSRLCVLISLLICRFSTQSKLSKLEHPPRRKKRNLNLNLLSSQMRPQRHCQKRNHKKQTSHQVHMVLGPTSTVEQLINLVNQTYTNDT